MKTNSSKLVTAAPVWAGLVAVLFYLPGLSRFALPGDPSVYLVRAAELRLDGFAQTHSLYLIMVHFLSRLPGLDTPIAASLLSAVSGGVTVALVYAIVRRLTGSNWAAVAGAVCLAVSHTMWFYASIAEVYTLNSAFLAGMILLALCWVERPRLRYAFALTFLGGLGMANHMLAGLSLLVCGGWLVLVVVKRRYPMRHLVVACAGGIMGLLLLVGLVARDAQVLGWSEALRMAAVGGSGVTGGVQVSYEGALGGGGVTRFARQAAGSFAALLYNLPGLPLVLIVPGIGLLLTQGWVALLLVGLFAVHFLFGAVYSIHEYWAFLLPSWVVASVVAGAGFDIVAGTVGRVRGRPGVPLRWLGICLLGLLPVAVYRLAPLVASRRGAGAAGVTRNRFLTSRQYATFYLWPPKRHASTEETRIAALMTALPADSGLAMKAGNRALAAYLQTVKTVRPDIAILSVGPETVGDALSQGRPVFSIELGAAKELAAAGFAVVEQGAGEIWQVTRPDGKP